MNNENRNKSLISGKALGILIVIAFFAPYLLIFIAPFGLLYVLLRAGLRTGEVKQADTARSAKRETPFDDCPRPFCFHKDKGEHHVKRGREIDPWDRPDIDISKYQRR